MLHSDKEACGSKSYLFFDCLILFVLRVLAGPEEESKSCYYEFTNQSFGVLVTPLEESGAESNSSCSWLINVSEENRIAVSIRTLHLMGNDMLTVTEYKTISNSTLINRKVFDKDNRPEDVIYSASNNVRVDFIDSGGSEENVQTTALLHNILRLRKFYAIFEIENCGGLLNTPAGVLEIPSYIHLSMKSHECTWRIVAPEDNVISLTFNTFEVGPGSCLFNMLYIRDGLTSMSDLIGSYCEEYPPLGTIRSSSNGLTITYRTRPTFLATKIDMIPRIKISYSFQESCGGLLEGFSGSFMSPLSSPPTDGSCLWAIRVPKSNHVILTLKSYHVKTVNETGLQEMLNFYDGQETNNSLIWSSSWLQSPPPSLFSTKRQMMVAYTANTNANTTVRLQFKVSFRAVHERLLPTDKCRTVGTNKLFQCDENQYIYCHLTCNGIRDCENGMDEQQCLIHYSQVEPRENENTSKVEVGYLILSFALFGSAMLACMLVVAIDRLCRSRITTMIKEEAIRDTRNRNPGEIVQERNTFLPPYQETEVGRDAPPRYEEIIGEEDSYPESFLACQNFDQMSGRGCCQSPLLSTGCEETAYEVEGTQQSDQVASLPLDESPER